MRLSLVVKHDAAIVKRYSCNFLSAMIRALVAHRGTALAPTISRFKHGSCVRGREVSILRSNVQFSSGDGSVDLRTTGVGWKVRAREWIIHFREGTLCQRKLDLNRWMFMVIQRPADSRGSSYFRGK